MMGKRREVYVERNHSKPLKQRTAKKADFLGFPDRNLNPSQLAERLGVKKQPRAVELERGEANGKITVQSLERAQALGCRLVLGPEKRLADIIRERASLMAERHLAAVEQTMLLEGQAVTGQDRRKESHRRLTEELLRRPARLWDEP